MANIFPKWTNFITIRVAVGLAAIGITVVVAVAYYCTPKYTRVGYMPTQPVAFDHSLHAGQLGMDCRFCHSHVEVAGHSNVPTVQVCMSCHGQVQSASPKLEPIRAAWNNGVGDGPPVRWVRIHKAPDYVYFNHAIHVNSGVSCVSCHGEINKMEVVWHDQPQSMSWCLECHRNPEEFIRPVEKVYDLSWEPESLTAQRQIGEQLVEQWHINPPETCAGCHR